MAAILEKVLSKEISASNLVTWLSMEKSQATQDVLDVLLPLREEFMPFFLNYLRDQTVHLTQGSRSAHNTPAKTPTACKLKKLSFIAERANTSVGHGNNTHTGNRSLSFASPIDNSSTSAKRLDTSLDSSANVSHVSRGSNSSVCRPGSSGAARRGSGRTSNRSESGGKSQRSIQFNTPEFHRTKQKQNLGDFLLSPELDNRHRKSPHASSSFNNGSPSPHTRRRSTGKGQGSDRKGKQQLTPKEQTTAPEFSLSNSDFPPVASTPKSARVCDLSAEPTCSVITPSRRITPVCVPLSDKSNTDNQLFTNSPELPANSAKPRGVPSVWDRPPGRASTGPPAGKDKRTETQLPADCKVITSSRRITPMRVETTPCSQPVNNPVFQSSPYTSSPASSASASASPCRGRVKPLSSVADDGEEALDEQASGDVSVDGNDKTGPNLHGVTPIKYKSINSASSASDSTVTPTKSLLLERLVSVDIVRAEASQVTHKDELTALAQLYSGCISGHLMPNVTVELYFLLQLLCCRGGEADPLPDSEVGVDLDEMQYFQSVHNAVFFTVMVLSLQTKLLALLDRGTLRLLVDNPRVGDFLPGLKDRLTSMLEQMPAKGTPSSLPSPIGGVSFQADTDNQKNFPSERAFHLFKKQRDSFYELLREWEESRLTPGWSMVDMQGARIFQLVSYKTELANHIHLARLFLSQLIQMCKGDHGATSEGDEEQITLLTQLKLANPEKLKKLRERFVTPSSHGGPCPPPSFPGCQEYFRDFILVSSNHIFNQHLTDIMACKLDELNKTQLTSMEMECKEDEDVIIDAEDRETILNSVLTLKLLGKFLGLITFLPYRSAERLPETMLASCLLLRNKSQPPVDLVSYLKSCLTEGTTMLTVPWVVEFLSMMDPLAPKTTYFHTVLVQLLQVQRHVARKFACHQRWSQLLVLVLLGWLFELAIFPAKLFFSESESISYSTANGNKLTKLDDLDVLDQQMLYSCCPFLGELRNVLMEFTVGVGSGNSSVKRITATPILADAEPVSRITDKHVQHQLEENFFHNHPASLRRTVDFVADRIASNHIKNYRADIFPRLLKASQQKAKLLAEHFMGSQETDTVKQKKTHRELEGYAVQLSVQAKRESLITAPSYCSGRAGPILEQLLPDDTPSQVVEVTTQIVQRTVQEKIVAWLNTHITPNIFKKELTSELEKQVKALMSQSALPKSEDANSGITKEIPTFLQPNVDTKNLKEAVGENSAKDTTGVGSSVLTVDQIGLQLNHIHCDSTVKRTRTGTNRFEPVAAGVLNGETEVTVHQPSCNLSEETKPGGTNIARTKLMNYCDALKSNACDNLDGKAENLSDVAALCKTLAPARAGAATAVTTTNPATVTAAAIATIIPAPAATIPEPAITTDDMMESVNKEKVKSTIGTCLQHPSECLITIKNVVKNLLRDPAQCSEAQIHKAIHSVSLLMDNTQVAMPQVIRTTSKLVVEMAFILVLSVPHLWTAGVETELLSLWRRLPRSPVSIDRALCPKHLLMLHKSPDTPKCSELFVRLLSQLVAEDLVSLVQVTESAFTMLQLQTDLRVVHLLCEVYCWLLLQLKEIDDLSPDVRAKAQQAVGLLQSRVQESRLRQLAAQTVDHLLAEHPPDAVPYRQPPEVEQ